MGEVFTDDHISWVCSNYKQLKGLIFLGENIRSHEIIRSFGHQLISLHLNPNYVRDGPTSFGSKKKRYGVNFQELCVNTNVEAQVIKHFIDSAEQLQRFHWAILDEERLHIDIFSTLLKPERGLQYLSVCSPFKVFEIFKEYFMIHSELINIHGMTKTNNFKIKWHWMQKMTTTRIAYLKNNLLEFVRALEQTVTNDFMFIFRVRFKGGGEKHKDTIATFSAVLDEIKSNYGVNKHIYAERKSSFGTVFTGIQTVIYNKNNTMNGYQEAWAYTCSCCRNCKCYNQ